jgi:ribose transport system substrate-binding protein
MERRSILKATAVAGVAAAIGLGTVSAQAQDAKKYSIALIPGLTTDAFYITMRKGAQAAADALGVELIFQGGPDFNPTVQVPVLNAVTARQPDAILIAPTDKQQLIAPLKQAHDAGIKVITVDTFLGDGDYVNGPVKFPISYIGSDNVEGGRISARGLAEAIGGKGSVYINSTNPNVSSVEGRAAGFKEVMENEFPEITIIGLDFNLDDMNTAVQQTAAVLQRVPDLAGVFGTNVFSAQGAGTAVVNAGLGGHVQVVAYDATQFAIEQLREGVVSLVLAQKPFDMGYMAVQFAAADAAGVTSLPRRVETGFAIIDKDNVDDPAVARFIYQVPGK